MNVKMKNEDLVVILCISFHPSFEIFINSLRVGKDYHTKGDEIHTLLFSYLQRH